MAHMATADAGGAPHAVPICYAFDGLHLYSVIDLKPKRVAARGLKRVRNILANSRVAIVIDDYDEEWEKLAYVLIQGPRRGAGGRRGAAEGGDATEGEVSAVQRHGYR